MRRTRRIWPAPRGISRPRTAGSGEPPPVRRINGRSPNPPRTEPPRRSESHRATGTTAPGTATGRKPSITGAVESDPVEREPTANHIADRIIAGAVEPRGEFHPSARFRFPFRNAPPVRGVLVRGAEQQVGRRAVPRERPEDRRAEHLVDVVVLTSTLVVVVLHVVQGWLRTPRR